MGVELVLMYIEIQDLTLVSISLALNCEWAVYDECLLRSGHFPIFITINRSIQFNEISWGEKIELKKKQTGRVLGNIVKCKLIIDALII